MTTQPAVWRTGETLTLAHLAEYVAVCDRADTLSERLDRAVAVTSRQRAEINRLHNLIRALQEART